MYHTLKINDSKGNQDHSALLSFPVELTWQNLLLIIVFLVDLWAPFLINKGYIPSITRMLSDVVLLIIIVVAIARMLLYDHLPKAFILVVSISLIGGVVAIFGDQDMLATLWGWWTMFKFPMVGIYAYLHHPWPAKFEHRLFNLCMLVLAIEVLVQVSQYLGGQVPGDSLAGTFGSHGVSLLAQFMLFCVCLALGEWLFSGNWKTLLYVMVLGSISSGLGEIKVFLFALIGLALLAFIIHLMRGKQLNRLIIYIAAIMFLVVSFASFYNSVVAEATGARRLEEYYEIDTLDEYLNSSFSTNGGTSYYFGRSYRLRRGWASIQKDATTFLFGMGLGAYSESQALGVVGIALQQDGFGSDVSTSTLVVFMQELGILGLIIFAGFMIWFIFTLFWDIRQEPDSSLTTLRYGMILFTVFWPLWMYYGSVWLSSVPMMLYWVTLAFLIAKSRGTCSLI